MSDGDCFRVAANLVVELGEGHTLCHGEPLGQGKIAGVRHAHAWVERSDTVDSPGVGPYTVITCIDRSNGKDVSMPQVLYYKIGRLDERPIRRYSHREAVEKMVETGTYGPWDE